MKSFYSVLYIKSEPVFDEKNSVGLFLNTDKRPVFDFSEEKLKIAANLVGSDTIDSLSRMLRNIKKKTATISNDPSQTEAFDINPFTESYFNYLNNYSNNLLLYSKPSDNHGDFDRSDYVELFRLLIDRSYGLKAKEEEIFKDSVKKRKLNPPLLRRKRMCFTGFPKKR